MEKHKVLVPLDGSDFSRQIFPVLARFLQPEANHLILLRVGAPSGGLVGAPPRPAGQDGIVVAYETVADAEQAAHPIYASQERESDLAAFIAESQNEVRKLEAVGFTVSYELRSGSPEEEIVEYVNTHDVNLIAITTHWRTGINRLLFGNTVQYITPRVHIPLLMLRPESDEE